MAYERIVHMQLLNLLSVSVDTIEWIALSLATSACGLVALALIYTRQYRQQSTVNVEQHYIADDEISWTELMRILD